MLETALEVARGDGVRFRLTVTNGGDEPIDLTFRDACRADFAVYSDDTELWRYSNGRAFAQVLTDARLEPGETATFAETWPDPRPGEYTAEATLRVIEHEVSERVPFTV